jgi:hypothetical protein
MEGKKSGGVDGKTDATDREKTAKARKELKVAAFCVEHSGPYIDYLQTNGIMSSRANAVGYFVHRMDVLKNMEKQKKHWMLRFGLALHRHVSGDVSPSIGEIRAFSRKHQQNRSLTFSSNPSLSCASSSVP